MREIRPSGSEGGGTETNRSCLPLSRPYRRIPDKQIRHSTNRQMCRPGIMQPINIGRDRCAIGKSCIAAVALVRHGSAICERRKPVY